ncbi:glycosyltransferase [Mycobacterium sp. C3-094]
MDTTLVLSKLIGRRIAYFIHTQENGLAGATSDSFWRFAPTLHRRLERRVVRSASQVVVFNEQYADVVRHWNPRARASPTWFDPDLFVADESGMRDPHTVIWVGRLEIPKDPLLALAAFRSLSESAPGMPWRLQLVGTGTLKDKVDEILNSSPPEIRERVRVHGRTPPGDVAQLMSQAGLLLMTSHPGYEGYPRVLVEALASGLPAVVTDGSDTGSLIVNGENGYVTSREPAQIAERLKDALHLSRSSARNSVAHLSAPEVISRMYADS